MRPDRIIVGEVRGAEALDMVQAMNTGHDGSISTGHANSPEDMLSRIETMILMGSDMPLAAIRKQIASSIDIIIQLGRLRDRSRRVIEICELLEVNPYHLYGEKCFIAIVPEGGSALEKLKAAGISARLVGHTTDKKAHILFNDGTESHLNRPEPDELERLGLLRD